jgi:ADP-heptose:LPS heptosyltransferase
MPVTQRHALVFKKLGFPVELNNPVYPERRELTHDILQITGPKTGPWIGIAPFAQHQGKVYPQDLMQEIVNELSQHQDYKLFLFGGGRREAEILDIFANDRENVMVVAGKMNLTQELHLISNLNVMLSMDSGNAHMAAMLGVNTVTLWGATHPYAGFAPFGQPEDNTIVSNRDKYPLLPTSIYGNKKVEGYEDAMRTILTEDVVNKINRILKK